MQDKDFTLRQLNLMLQCITQFEEQQIDLRKLIDSLEALLNIMDTEEDKWKEDFLSSWGILEDIYSIAVTNQITTLKNEEVEEIERAINFLKAIITDRIKYLKVEIRKNTGYSE